MKIWLDDIRPAPEGWTHAYTAHQAIALLLSEASVEVISLDHDLGDDEKFGTGYTVMQWIEEYCFCNTDWVLPEIRFHSANPVGVKKMQACLDSIQRKNQSV